MKIAFFGDSITAGIPGASYFNILGKLLLHHELVNFAHGGDSVIGAYEKVSNLKSSDVFDLVFLWIGTNDIFVKVSWMFPLFRRLMRQPWSRNVDEFRTYYDLILGNLHGRAKCVYAISPWLVGEDVNNKWNIELDGLSAEVVALSSVYNNVHYLDIREIFKTRLASEHVSSYVASSILGVARDVLMLKKLHQINRTSRNRGLHYTLDGVHLNEQGAEIVADIFFEVIDKAQTQISI